ncbi:predicted protein [Chaetomium globosum CBS 148.51]|uniref:Uncharacterized protein n=1 Tax=Chaetomium globosum (strain ATCC 6205 / CBS 148.51 / DSM 1962 / NBRC 6347 / NRRL 1970) TaxID=306901 RepID=Q2HEE1_CHAGB|nr:uncharacterized protein CHGG_01413 [Chaetomium globosum CBS 148.51]EAQ93178.1 predicted protein [Chaetomium globosum CBS 148.51]
MRSKIVRDPTDACVEYAWTHVSAEGKAIAWPESFLGNLTPRARIIAYDYDVELEDFWATEEENRIDALSDDLSHEIRSVRASSKTFLVKAEEGRPAEKLLAKCVHRMALLGTPFHTDAALWAKTGNKFYRLTGGSPDGSLEDDLSKSEKLAAISKGFKTSVGKGTLEVAVFYEGKPSPVSGEVITSLATVKVPGAPSPTRLATSHQAMARAATAEDDHFRRISRVLVEWVEELSEEEDVEKEAKKVAKFEGDNIGGFQLGFNDGTINGGVNLGGGVKPRG